MAENSPRASSTDDERPKPPKRSSTWFSSPVQAPFRRPTTPVKSKTWLMKSRPEGPERSNSWSFSGAKRINSANPFNKSSNGANGATPVAPSAKLFKRFCVEELGALAGTVTFGPTALFSGSVVTNAKVLIPNATISVTFQGIAQAKGFSATFVNVTQKLAHGELKAGPRSVLFAFRFPHVNLPPTSKQPLIKYIFTATLQVGDDTNDRFLSHDLEIKFHPTIDPTMSRADPMSDAAVLQEKDGGKEDTGAVESGDEDEAPATSGRPSSACELYAEPESGKVVAGAVAKLPGTVFLPGDNLVANLELYVPEGKDEPKFMTVTLEETKKFVIDSTEDDAFFRSTPETVRTIKNEIVPLFWTKIVKTTNEKKQASSDKSAKPSSPGTETKAIDGQHSLDAIQIGKVLLQTFRTRIPDHDSFIAEGLLPTCSLPLNGSFNPPEKIAGIGNAREKKPVHYVEDIPFDRANNGIGMRMMVQHQLHFAIPLASPRIIVKRPVLHLYTRVTLGNVNPKTSQRQIDFDKAAAAKRKRSASMSTNPSFLLTTAPDDGDEYDGAPSLSRRTSSSAEKGKTPLYRLRTDSSEEPRRDSATSITHYIPGSPIIIELDAPYGRDERDENDRQEIENTRIFKTLAETQERPYFFKTEFEDPFPE